jgi:hypothetical protein
VGPLLKVASWVVRSIAAALPRAVGVVLLSFATVAVTEAFVLDAAESSGGEFLLLVGLLVGGLLGDRVVDRVSLHEPYRDRLARCFGVVHSTATELRSGESQNALSALTPPPRGGPRSFPRLLVCATANVLWRRPDGKRATLAPWVFSHDACGIPGVPGAWFATSQLELVRVRRGILKGHWEQPVSAVAAMATTGAAVSPTMGAYTVPSLRPLAAATNVRLGVWLPNPLSERTRQRVAAKKGAGRLERDARLGRGFTPFVGELFGLHPADGSHVYVSDGGHHDNLGLLTLLRARCSEIWCIDASPDRRGTGKALRLAISQARHELSIEIDLSTAPFAVAGGLMTTTHTVGTIRYPGASVSAGLIVLKLGLERKSPLDLHAYRKGDRSFPHHATWRQGYSRERFAAYVRLGRWVADQIPAS